MNEMAAFTAIDRTTLTRIADQLVAGAHVERKDNPKDRRQVLLVATESGRALYREALAVVFSMNSRLLEGVPDPESRAAARVLQRIVANLAPTLAARDSIIHYSREASRNPGGSARLP